MVWWFVGGFIVFAIGFKLYLNWSDRKTNEKIRKKLQRMDELGIFKSLTDEEIRRIYE